MDALAELPGADFNSLLLEVFSRRAAAVTAPALLQQYKQNRFVKPGDMDTVALLETQLAALRILEKLHFKAMTLSPVSPLGSCSVLGTVSQNKVMSAARGTEVMADATNALALHIAELKQQGGPATQDLCAAQRHIRTQPPLSKGFMPHFTIASLVSAGVDKGNYGFECESMYKHTAAWAAVLKEVYGIHEMRLRFLHRDGYPDGRALAEDVSRSLTERIPGLVIETAAGAAANNYYTGLQFKVVIDVKEQEWEIADGGFTTWTQQLPEKKIQRLLISGFGLELLKRISG